MMQPWFRECFELDDRYMVVLLVLCSVNKLFTLLYSCGAWLRRHEAAEVSSLGFTVLRGIRKLADMSLLRGEPRFPLHSKNHALWHTFARLAAGSERGLDWIESPLTDSCQQDEGFVGHISRYTRRVSPQQTVARALDIYLTSLRDRWCGN